MFDILAVAMLVFVPTLMWSICQVRRQELDRDFPAKLAVACPVDLSHATLAEQVEHLVLA